MNKCTPLFHARCIKSFEKFAHEQCCPICRSAKYQKRRIRDGRVAFRKKAATRVQAWYRGRAVQFNPMTPMLKPP